MVPTDLCTPNSNLAIKMGGVSGKNPSIGEI